MPQNILPKLCVFVSKTSNKSKMKMFKISTTESPTPSGMLTRPRPTTLSLMWVGGATQSDCDTVMQQGVTRMQLLVLNMVFLGRLREDICTRVLEDGPTKSNDSAKAAREIDLMTRGEKKATTSPALKTPRRSHLKPFLSYLPCIVFREYFSIISNIRKYTLYSIKYGTYHIIFLYRKSGEINLFYTNQKHAPFDKNKFLRSLNKHCNRFMR
jgi:hypothetical protein